MKYYLITVLTIFISCQTQNNEEEQQDKSTSIAEPTEEVIPDTIKVEAKDYVYLPPQLEVQAGQNVLIRMVNNGEHAHNLKIAMPGDTVEFDEAIPQGSSRLLKFKASDRPGTYRFYCPMRNDSSLGMKGELLISSKK